MISHRYKTENALFLLFATAQTFCASRHGLRNSDFVKTVPRNSKDFCSGKGAGSRPARTIEIQMKIGGNHTFFSDN